MMFNSIEFALFLPLVFFTYWFVICGNLRAQNIFVILASYLFYGWWDWRFLSLIILSSAIDFVIGLQLDKKQQPKSRIWLLGLSLAANIGLLGFFKYYNFFADQLVDAFARIGFTLHLKTLEIILPVGISFYTFQTLSYTIDVYRRRIRAVSDWTAFFAYVSFFPQLVAGPIERAVNLIPQFTRPRTFSYEKAKDGLRQILLGLFKKMVIADSCALIVNEAFSDHESYGAGFLLFAVILFAFQIYGDFSGYSDIAIGTARLFGIDLMQNFAFPYFSRDIAEFWRRWHISLSTWFRDYLYIPLGGSRVNSTRKLILNVFIIFLISGLWHGANWTFIIWGFLNALYFLPSILLKRNRRYLDVPAKGKILPDLEEATRMAATFSLVCFSWIFFRAENLSHAIAFITQIVKNPVFAFEPIRKNGLLILGILLLLVAEWLQRDKLHAFRFDDSKSPAAFRLAVYMGTSLSILLFSPGQKSPFIYFQF